MRLLTFYQLFFYSGFQERVDFILFQIKNPGIAPGFLYLFEFI